MKRARVLHVVLAIVGIGALTAYLVACRPSWSPDGSRVLFPYINPETEVAGIALFDKATGTVRSVFVMPGAPAKLMPGTQWAADGESAIVIWPEAAEGQAALHVCLQPVQSQKPARQFVIRDCEWTFALPLAELAGSLFVGGESLVRLDLETGKVKRRKLEEGQVAILAGGRKQIHYLGGRPGPISGYEIGTVDPEKLALRRLRTLKSSDVGEIIHPFLDVAGDGLTLAMSSVNVEQKWDLLIVAGQSLKKTIPLELSRETHAVGNLQWSPDGQTIYAALIVQLKGLELLELGVLEVTVETGATRRIPLVRIRPPSHDSLPSCWQIAISPDGKTIAASPTYVWKELTDKKNLALHLVDLTSPDRTVTRIPVPRP